MPVDAEGVRKAERHLPSRDRKSTRLNSSHLVISYAVFCLKKKKNTTRPTGPRSPAQLSRPRPESRTVHRQETHHRSTQSPALRLHLTAVHLSLRPRSIHL